MQHFHVNNFKFDITYQNMVPNEQMNQISIADVSRFEAVLRPNLPAVTLIHYLFSVASDAVCFIIKTKTIWICTVKPRLRLCGLCGSPLFKIISLNTQNSKFQQNVKTAANFKGQQTLINIVPKVLLIEHIQLVHHNNCWNHESSIFLF
jgi:hypothetical protein